MNIHRIALRPDEILFREGDPPTTAFLVESGSVAIHAGKSGDTVQLAVIGPGDIVGEMAVIDDSPRTATAIALEHVVLLPVDRAQIAERLIHADPVIRGLLQGQLKRYRTMLAAMQGHATADDVATNADADAIAGMGKIRLEAQLREALAAASLDLRLQPLLDLAQDRVAGYEALVRWTHPERGPVSPMEFIALAEETSLIVPVGDYVLDQAVAALCALRDSGRNPLPFIAINVSPRQLREAGLVERIVERTSAAGLAPSLIKVEITESQALDYAQVGEAIAQCRRAGIRVALDDFGTGFSNLAHLHELEFDTIKIDQAFARTAMHGARARAMLEAIVALVHAAGAEALVEGIEFPEQLDLLRRLGCRHAQGYLIGHPQPLAHVLANHPA